MPVYKITHNGKPAYRFGRHGKIYTGKNAKEKAVKQGEAIYFSKLKQMNKNKKSKK